MTKHKKILVQKFGGTSVADVERIKKVAKRIQKYCIKGYKLVVIVSALGKTTDNLVKLVSGVSRHPSGREMDSLLATGEQISSALLALALQELGIKAVSLLGFQIGIKTDSIFTRARILDINPKRLYDELERHGVIIVAGFQGINHRNDITTLGRGGSDLSAVALAHVLNAQACEIYTDVEGIYTTDPRLVPQARKIKSISYEEMLELASSGAQVMQARSIEFAGKYNVPIHVRSSFSTKEGTWIIKGDKKMEQVLVRGVSLVKDEAKLVVTNVSDKPGMAGKIFRALADKGINVDMIVQNIGHISGATDITFTIPAGDLSSAKKTIEKLSSKSKNSKILTDKEIAKISVVGIGMRSHSGVAADMFEVLGKNKINIQMISTSEIKISCIVHKKDSQKAVQLLHNHFKLNKEHYQVV